MKLWKKAKQCIEQKGALIIWGLAICCGLVMAVGYLFPKYAYEMTAYHVVLEDNENEIAIPLTAGTVVTYYLEIEDRAICGIQPCFDWGQDTCPEGDIVIEAWHEEGYPGAEAYVGGTRIHMDGSLRKAFAYAEIPNQNELKGRLVFTIGYEAAASDSESVPCVIATDRGMDTSRTFVDGTELEGDLLMYYASLKSTYPLIFDSRMMMLMLLAVGFTTKTVHARKKPDREGCTDARA